MTITDYENNERIDLRIEGHDWDFTEENYIDSFTLSYDDNNTYISMKEDTLSANNFITLEGGRFETKSVSFEYDPRDYGGGTTGEVYFEFVDEAKGSDDGWIWLDDDTTTTYLPNLKTGKVLNFDREMGSDLRLGETVNFEYNENTDKTYISIDGESYSRTTE